MVYVAGTIKIALTAEALNMVEAVGEFSRHRLIPAVYIIGKEKKKPVLVYVPAVSGQSLAHGYQEQLAKLATMRGIKVCGLCQMGSFVKHGLPNIFLKDRVRDEYKILNRYDPNFVNFMENLYNLVSNDNLKDAYRLMLECVVEDIGGFLIPDLQLKRTSVVSFSYMVPVARTLGDVQPQMYTRAGVQATREHGQMIFHEDLASALYHFAFGLDIQRVGRAETPYGTVELPLAERLKRIELALDAFVPLIDSLRFGAKKSRKNPLAELHSVAVTISHPLPFRPEAAFSTDYIAETVKRAITVVNYLEDYGQEIKIYYYTKYDEKPAGGNENKVTVEEAENFVDLMKKVKEEILKLYQEKEKS
ncbi:MAG: hypothetical protein DRJ59_03500 [Thermoprotei archaeon]|nr:MAG: hypothetical protein DRJ59_03500 [Thermoprotei archaeon]